MLRTIWTFTSGMLCGAMVVLLLGQYKGLGPLAKLKTAGDLKQQITDATRSHFDRMEVARDPNAGDRLLAMDPALQPDANVTAGASDPPVAAAPEPAPEDAGPPEPRRAKLVVHAPQTASSSGILLTNQGVQRTTPPTVPSKTNHDHQPPASPP